MNVRSRPTIKGEMNLPGSQTAVNSQPAELSCEEALNSCPADQLVLGSVPAEQLVLGGVPADRLVLGDVPADRLCWVAYRLTGWCWVAYWLRRLAPLSAATRAGPRLRLMPQ